MALDLRGRAFAEKLFHVIDKDNTGSVSTEQLVTHLLGLQNGSLEDRIAFTFSVVSGGSKNQDVTFQQLIEVLQVRSQALSCCTMSCSRHWLDVQCESWMGAE